MGEIAARLADVAVVTSDNPRSEDPGSDRRRDPRGDARRRAPRSRSRSTARPRSRSRSGSREPGDTVVIAGKGHEQGQEFEHGRKIPFDDREVAREELRALASAAGARA